MNAKKIDSKLNAIIKQENIDNIKIVKVNDVRCNLVGKYCEVELINKDTNESYKYSIYETSVAKKGLDTIILEILNYCR